jgi:DNA-binding response OmpR family regulator
MPTVSHTRVLIVDDNRDAADLLGELLSAEGFITDTAYDGYMALDHALSFEPDIVILDLNMPRFSGDEVAPMLRQVQKLKHVHIIALTSMDDSEARALTSRTGFDIHLAKPVQMAELLAALAAAN